MKVFAVILLCLGLCFVRGQDTNYIQGGSLVQKLEWVPVIVTIHQDGTNYSFSTILITNQLIYQPIEWVQISGTNYCKEVITNITISHWYSNIVWEP